MFVIIEHGGKQYKVRKNDIIKVEKIDELENKNVVFKKILFVENADNETLIGTPYVENFAVKASLIDVIKDKKVLIFKKKRRHNYRRKLGHRQTVAIVKIIDIIPISEISNLKKVNTNLKKNDSKTKSKESLKKDSTNTSPKKNVSDVKKKKKIQIGEKNGS